MKSLFVIKLLFLFSTFTGFFVKTIELSSVETDVSDEKTASSEVQEVNDKVKPDGNQEIKMQEFSIGGDFPKLNTHEVWANQLFEGCLLLDEKDKELLSSPVDSRNIDKKTYISFKQKLWPSNVIPYEIVSINSNKKSKALFEAAVYGALDTVRRGTCVQFRKKTNSDRNWILFYSGSGCWSGLGRKYWTNKATFVSLGPGCWKESIAIHQLFHALGFFHEQNRPDRDDYVRIKWKNIIDSKKTVFKRHYLYNTDMFTKDYDFQSIMHYNRFFYTRHRPLMTIVANHNQNLVLGGNKPSKLDFQRLNKMFCDGKPTPLGKEDKKVVTTDIPVWTQWTQCSRECGLGHRFRTEKCFNDDCKNARHETSACRLKLCDYSRYATNFEENGMGIWSSPKPYKRACVWKLVMSIENGLTDHTTGKGKFMMVDLSEVGCTKYTSVTLKSTEIEKNTRWKCLNFYYYMHGKNAGDLIVRLIYKNGVTSELWKRSGDQGTDWKQGTVSLPLTDKEYQLMFEYIVDSENGVYVLLDDIYIDEDKCIEGAQKCTDTDDRCPRWSKHGECFKNPTWMMRACCKSCSSLEKCVDRGQYCKYILNSKNGCMTETGDTELAWRDCCRTCDSCWDQNPNCKKWQKEGECSKNREWMSKNCKRSCNVPCH